MLIIKWKSKKINGLMVILGYENWVSGVDVCDGRSDGFVFELPGVAVEV